MKAVDNIRKQIADSIRNATADKSILRLLLSRLQMLEGEITDEVVTAQAKLLIKQNNDAIEKLKEKGHTPNEDFVNTINSENAVLSQFLPTYLSAVEIEKTIRDNDATFQQILAANEKAASENLNVSGAAIGMAIKLFKKLSLPVENVTLVEVVSSIKKV